MVAHVFTWEGGSLHLWPSQTAQWVLQALQGCKVRLSQKREEEEEEEEKPQINNLMIYFRALKKEQAKFQITRGKVITGPGSGSALRSA